MKKRMLSLLLVLVMTVSLFAGLTTNAGAATVLTDLFEQLVNENQDTLNKMFDPNNVLYSGSCGKGGTASVKYEVYRLDDDQIRSMEFPDKIGDLKSGLSELASKFGLDAEETTALTGLDFNLDLSADEYYAVKITGTGEMEDYSLTSKAPWSGKIEVPGYGAANMDKQLIAAYIDTGVTNVGKRAFFGLDALRAVYLGGTVKVIDEKAFKSCDKLTVIDFPNSLERIERQAFYACDYLTYARMKSCINLKYIGDRAFFGCERLASITFPTSVAEIGNFAFAYDHVLGTVQFSLPEKLSKLGTGAFWWCTHLGAVNEVNIPASLTSISPWAFFANFAMRELKFSAGDQALTIGTGAFSGCRALKTVHFADRVKHISDFAFAACDSLTDVVFGTGNGTDLLHATTIGKRTFTSLEATGLEALTRVADTMSDSDEETATYLGHTLTLGYGISQVTGDKWGVTPLAEATFTYEPITKGNIEPATSDFNSFPKDCVIIYPTQSNNAQAYAKWTAAITSAGLWEGYQTKSAWSGHTHKYGFPEEVHATCTEPGYTVRVCSICGEEEITETSKPTGHKATMDRMVAPTCTEPGVAYYTCTNKWCTDPNYTVEIPATNHGEADGYSKLQNRVETKPTCTQEGKITGVCPDCGKTVSVAVPALGHDTTYMNKIQEATCSQQGIYQGRCSRCNESVRVTVDPLGHTWDEGHITKRATETQNGERTYICTVCGEKKFEVIPRTTQTVTYTQTVVEPTCTQQGYTLFKGSDGSNYKDNFVPATGHKWGDGVVTKEATANGEKLFTCSVCGEKKTEAIPAIGTTSFTDVPADAFFYSPVLWAVNQGITKGTTPTTFSPNVGCTRGEAVTFLYRAAGSPEVTGINPFTDVHSSDFFYKAVLWAAEKGITKGTDEHTFSPYDVCQRSQIVTFLYRAKGSPNVSAPENFFDVGPMDFFYDAVRWAVLNGVTKGTDTNTFSPLNTCTRGEIVTFLYRAREL